MTPPTHYTVPLSAKQSLVMQILNILQGTI